MTGIRHLLPILIILPLFLFATPGWAKGEEAGAAQAELACSEALDRLQEQNRGLSGDLRRIHRELAALRQDLADPGMKEAFSGIGYILGLFGVAFFFMGRKERRRG